MKSDYPTELLKQWTLALNVFNPFLDRIKYLISFGSYLNKDFYYLKIDNKIYFTSDFEFSIILSESEMNDTRFIGRINREVSNYNEAYSKLHLGHNLNIKISTLSAFIKSAENYTYFKNALIKTGKILNAKSNIFNFVGKYCEKVTPKDITYIFHQLINYSLLHFDSRFIKEKDLFKTYVLHDINKTCLKLLTLFAAYQNHYPNNYFDAKNFLFTHMTSFQFDYDFLFKCKNESLLASESSLQKAIQEFKNLLSVAISLFEKKTIISQHLMSDLNLLITILDDFPSIDPCLNDFRIKRVKDFILRKGENYNYYRTIYDII